MHLRWKLSWMISLWGSIALPLAAAETTAAIPARRLPLTQLDQPLERRTDWVEQAREGPVTLGAARDSGGQPAAGGLELRATGPARGTWASQPVALEVGQPYELAAQVECRDLSPASPEATGVLLMMESWPPTAHPSLLAGTMAWTAFHQRFTATAHTDRIILQLGGAGRASGTARLRAIRLSRVPGPPGRTTPIDAVQWYGPAYRYSQAGWTVLHVEGEPYERGYQHGLLLAPEIEDAVRSLARLFGPKAPDEAWQNARVLANALFLRRYRKEFLLEMKGIADGAAARAAKFGDRLIDFVDIVTLNSWIELEFLEPALEATPTGLEGMAFKPPRGAGIEPVTPRTWDRNDLARAGAGQPPDRCSAFAATGPATADGKVVIGHITMYHLYPARLFNVWLDIKPAQGHRVLMQTNPGGIQSNLDYYFNDAGIVIVETTLAQTRFDITGQSETSRIRQAIQYANTIDQAVEILRTANNGLYTNEWLLADTKTNEIALFELGTHTSRLMRSSKGQWMGGTEGFYWGCNNTKDLAVRLETVPSLDGRPANVVFHPSPRDLKWLELYHRYKGTIGVGFGFEAFTTPPLAAAHSLDAKFTTTDMVHHLLSWNLFGPPLGRNWKPTEGERAAHADIRPLVSNDWTVLDARPPAKPAPPGHARRGLRDMPAGESSAPVAGPVDLAADAEPPKPRFTPVQPPIWHGTVLPATDADIWLAVGFAEYQKIVAGEKGPTASAEANDPKHRRAKLALDLAEARSTYLRAAAESASDVPLSRIRSELTGDAWYRIAAGKGVRVLDELRKVLGDPKFISLMDHFGRDHAGQPVSTAEFRRRADAAAKASLAWFFDQWLDRAGTPTLALGDVMLVPGLDPKTHQHDFAVRGVIRQALPAYRMAVDVAVETDPGADPVVRSVALDGPATKFEIRVTAAHRPARLVVDPQGRSLKANGGRSTTASFEHDLDRTLIVRGTRAEAASNREAAETLQRLLRSRWSNITVPIVRDFELTAERARGKHLLLIGRPETNTVAARYAAAFPVQFIGAAARFEGKTYAHPRTYAIVAADNPDDPRSSLVLYAGLGAAATQQAVAATHSAAEVILVPAHGKARAAIAPARELVRDLALPELRPGAVAKVR